METDAQKSRSAHGEPPSSWLDVATSGPHLLIDLGGLGNMFAATMVQDLVQDWTRVGCRYLLMNLESCEGLDSTFMGTLVNLGDRLRSRGGSLRLYNVPEHCRHQLAMLGADSLLDFAGTGSQFPQMEFTRLVPMPDDSRRRAELVREAHTCLAGLSEANRERFGNYLKMLGEELDSMDRSEEQGDRSQRPGEADD